MLCKVIQMQFSLFYNILLNIKKVYYHFVRGKNDIAPKKDCKFNPDAFFYYL